MGNWYEPQPKQKPKRLPRRRPIKTIPSGIGDEGIVGNWLFYYLKGGDHLHDFSPYDNHGTISGAKWVSTKRGWGHYYDGVDDYTEVPDDPSLDQNTMTVSFWFKSTQTWDDTWWPASGEFVGRATAGPASSDWNIAGGSKTGGVDEGRIIAGVGYTSGTVMLYSDRGKNDGKWHHVTLVTVQNGKTELYIDGVLEDSSTNDGGTITNDKKLHIGYDPQGEYIEATISELRIYDRAL